jgi:hypothetical protein
MLKKTAPAARRVHAMLAAAMANPELLEHWRSSSSARKKTGAAALDLEKLHQFSGLVTKVRHNDVRLIAPFTFKLLDVFGISVEVFAAYAIQAHSLRKVGANSPSEKLQSLSSFLEQWLDHGNRLHSLVWDLIRHESAIHTLQNAAASTMNQSVVPIAQQLSPRQTPAPRKFVLHEMTCNPVELVRKLRSQNRKFQMPSREQHYFAYCSGGDTERIQVLELDAIGSLILDLADGSRSILQMRTILQKAGIGLSIQDLCAATAKLAAEGLLMAVGAPGG